MESLPREVPGDLGLCGPQLVLARTYARHSVILHQGLGWTLSAEAAP